MLCNRGLCIHYSFGVFSSSESRPVVSDSLRPHGLCRPWSSPGQNPGEGSLSLLQGIFPTQGSNPGLPHCRWILYQLSHQGSPRILEWVPSPADLSDHIYKYLIVKKVKLWNNRRDTLKKNAFLNLVMVNRIQFISNEISLMVSVQHLEKK